MLVVGQETYNCWYRANVDIKDNLFMKFQMREYHKFTNKQTSQPQSAFWRAIKYLKEELLQSKNQNNTDFVWTNLCKYDCNGKRPNKELQNEIFNAFTHENHVFLDEIKIYEPDVVIFMTGPQYDWYFERIFNDSVELLPVNDFSARAFARVKSKSLPFHSYRIYHPNYLSRTKQLNTILENIIQNFKQNTNVK